MFFDPLYFVFALPALLLALYAQMKVQSAYARWQQVPNRRGYPGYDTARALLSAGQMGEVGIEGVPGKLSDHYYPRARMLRVSGDVANGRSVASLAIVAHEIGHAEQDSTNYLPLKLRSAIVPAVQIGAWVGPALFFLGFLLRITPLAYLGLIAFAATTVFALVTLPVELNASSRALAMLRGNGLVTSEEEARGAKDVLTAAALTYVAALVQSIMTLLYYVLLLSGGSRRR
ncbi:MAG: zinc metallopeptidase [Chloroflexi bacterium]|nr:zinc metallopeptidase [Chloroflexota bacterium]